jgi:hypothetical protein
VGIRETLNRNPLITTIGTLVIVVIAIGFIIYSSLGSGSAKAQTSAFFSVDDGKTWFADDINKVAPFKTADGKEAVQVYVFSCKGGSEPFVAYLSRYTPEMRKQVEDFRAQIKSGKMQGPPTMAFMGKMQTAMEFKRPGDPGWTRMTEYQRYSMIARPTCPDGKMDNLVPVLP